VILGGCKHEQGGDTSNGSNKMSGWAYKSLEEGQGPDPEGAEGSLHLLRVRTELLCPCGEKRGQEEGELAGATLLDGGQFCGTNQSREAQAAFFEQAGRQDS